MKITVLGANGKTGIEVVKQALAAGHEVVGVAMQDSGVVSNPKLTTVVGDATDAKVIAKASKYSDVIISTLGATSVKSTLMTDAVRAVIAASATTGRKRFILMSSFVVESDRLKGMVKMMGGMMKGMVGDKTESENLVRNSNLDWTIVYATRLTTQPKGAGLRVVPEAEKITMSNKIARADVAAFMLEEAQKNAYVKAEVTISQ
jgi:putative NADH-flavin reductase